MILIVCPNLAVDVTLAIDALTVGAVHRAVDSRRQAGGKGVNVARALRSLGPRGESPFVLGYAGGRSGASIERGLDEDGIAHRLLPFRGESRSCTILLARDGTATVVNEPGPRIEDATPILSAFEELLPQARAVALMGSLPPGLPKDTYARMVAHARAKGTYCLLDTSGEALRAGIAARPSVVKPNASEAEELFGRPLASDSARVEAVDELRTMGADVAILTLGAEGFLIASAEARSRLTASTSSDLRLGNPTGAGDALAAGFLSGIVAGDSVEEAARLAAASARASLAEGFGRFRPKDVAVESIRVEALA